MGKLEKRLAAMRNAPTSVRFSDLRAVCEHYFGEPRQSGGSHLVFATPWPGDPRVNIQDRDGAAVPYQVRQVLAAIEKLEEER
ncbi:toxin HicA [Agrococcus sp. TSP3-2-1]|uniref:toxin HicA n=1 Tax=Agrococcus sp. TSP3-2-1 TaxID=2804583 RepID=UPI003CE86B3F